MQFANVELTWTEDDVLAFFYPGFGGFIFVGEKLWKMNGKTGKVHWMTYYVIKMFEEPQINY